MHPSSIEYLKEFSKVLVDFPHEMVNNLVGLLRQAREQGASIFVMGNGGSGSTASHWVCDMNKGTASPDHPRFRMQCLNDNSASVLAYSNDIGYEVIFEEQLKNFLNPGDLVIGISGSGNSPNVIKAIDFANAKGAVTIGISGYSGGKLRERARHSVHFPVNDMQIVEDLHMMTTHICMQALCATNPCGNCE